MSGAVARIVDDLQTRGGLKGSDLANITGVSPATVSRWASGKASPHPKTQLVISDLCYVVDCLAEFYTPEETRIWLYAWHPLMEGAPTGLRGDRSVRSHGRSMDGSLAPRPAHPRPHLISQPA